MKKLLSIIAALATVAPVTVPAAEARTSAMAYYASAYRQPIRVNNLHGPGSQIRRRRASAHVKPIVKSRGPVRRVRTAASRPSARSIERIREKRDKTIRGSRVHNRFGVDR